MPLLRTHPYTSVLIRTALLTVSALRNAHCQPEGMCFVFRRTHFPAPCGRCSRGGKNEFPCAISNTRGEALRCRARRGLGRESLHSGAATAPKILGAAEWHRALSRLLAARGGEEASASNRKEAALRAAGLYTTRGTKRGYTGGKVRFPPVLQVQCVLRKTKHISTGWLCT